MLAHPPTLSAHARGERSRFIKMDSLQILFQKYEKNFTGALLAILEANSRYSTHYHYAGAFIIDYKKLFQVQAADSIPKAESIAIGICNSTLKDALTMLETETPYRFFYNHRAIDVSQKVNVRLTGANIEEVLHELLKTTDVTFKVKRRPDRIAKETIG